MILYGGGDDGNALISAMLGAIMGFILLIMVAQYTTLPDMICGAMRASRPPSNLRMVKDRNMAMTEDRVPHIVPSSGVTRDTQKAEIARRINPGVMKPRPQGETADVVGPSTVQLLKTKPTVHLPNIRHRGTLKGADQVFQSNKVLLSSVQNNDLRKRVIAAAAGLKKVGDSRIMPYKTFDPVRAEMYADLIKRNKERIASQQFGKVVFDVPLSTSDMDDPDTEPRDRNIGRRLEIETEA
jgi:hypothetical protein